MLNKILLKISLYFTNTGLIPLSPIASLIGLLYLIAKISISPRFYKFEFFLLLFLIYFIISATIFYPTSLFDYDFYRYDGNIIISYLPIFALAFYKSNINEQTLQRFLIFSTIIYLISYIFWFLTKDCQMSGDCSFGGFYEARNATGGFLSILLTMSYIFWIQGAKKFKFLFIILLIMLISTFSRGSLVGVFTSIFIYYIFINKNILTDKILFIIFFTVSISVAIFFYDKSFDYTNESSSTAEFIDSGTSTKEANILIRAAYLFPKAIQIFTNNPIFGLGVGSFNDNGRIINNIQIYSPSHAHNSFLHFMAEMGTLGFLLFILFVYFFRKFWMNNRHKSILLADMAFFSFLSVLFASFTEHRITTPASMIIVSILIGVFISKIRFGSDRKSFLRYE